LTSVSVCAFSSASLKAPFDVPNETGNIMSTTRDGGWSETPGQRG
jgi:hypothetical protein